MEKIRIYKGTTKKLFVKLKNSDGSDREYDYNEFVLYAISDSRQRSGVVLSGQMEYDSESGTYGLELTPAQTDTLSEDERYWIDVIVRNFGGDKYIAVPIREIIVEPCNSAGVLLQ